MTAMRSIVTVTDAAAGPELVSLAAAKERLGITGNAQDAALAAFIKQGSATIAAECGRTLVSEAILEVFRLRSSADVIVLSRWPVSTLSSVAVDGVALTATDYETDAESGLLHRLSSDAETCWTGAKVSVAYTAGYTISVDVPADLELACLKLIRFNRSAASRDPTAKRIEIPDVMTTDYWVGSVGQNGALPPDVLDLIAPYKNRRA